MSSAVAPNRAISATILLMLVVTGGCLAMASAVPVANGRRLQQLSAGGSQLTSQLQALTSGAQKLGDQLQGLLQTVALPDDLRGQLQQVAANFAKAQSQLQSDVQSLLNLQMLGQPESATVVENLLSQIAARLDAVPKQLQNAQPIGGCFRDQQTALEAAISDLTSQLKLTTADLPMKPVDLITDLQNLGNAVGEVDACAPGLQALLSNDQGVLVAINELAAGIRQ